MLLRFLILVWVTQLGMADLYADLEVKRSATHKEIKRAYMKLSRQYHPDHNNEEAAKERYIKIRDAYEVLSKEEKRAQYDREGSYMFSNHPGMRRAAPIHSKTNDLGSYNWEYRLAEGPWFVWFYSDESLACHDYVFTWDAVAGEMKNFANFGRVNALTERPLTAQFSITKFPTVYFFPGDGSHPTLLTPHHSTSSILDTFFDYNPYDIPMVTTHTADAFLTSRPHLTKILYFVAEKGETDLTHEGVPLDLIRFHTEYLNVADVGIVPVGNKELMEQYGVMPWGRTLAVVSDSGRSVKRKSGGLRPHDSIKKFLDAAVWGSVPKLTRTAKNRCEGEGGTVCAVMAFPTSMSWDEKDEFLKIFGESGKFGTATKAWVHIEPQADTLQGLNIWGQHTEPVVVVFSTQYTELQTRFREFKNVAELREEGGDWVTDTTLSIRKQHVDTKLRPNRYSFHIVEEEEDTTTPPPNYSRLFSRLLRKLKSLNIDSFLWFGVVTVALRFLNPREVAEATQQQQQQPTSKPRRGPSVEPTSPYQKKWGPLTPRHFEKNIALLCLVPRRDDVKNIRTPKVLVNQTSRINVHLAYATEQVGDWYSFFGVEKGSVAVVCVRGGSKKYSVFVRGALRDLKWGAGKELQVKVDDFLAGRMGSSDFTRVDDWPAGKRWFSEGEGL